MTALLISDEQLAASEVSTRGETLVEVLVSQADIEVLRIVIPVYGLWICIPWEDHPDVFNVYLINGSITVESTWLETVLNKGDSLRFKACDKFIYLRAQADTEIIAISSSPIFHRYKTFRDSFIR